MSTLPRTGSMQSGRAKTLVTLVAVLISLVAVSTGNAAGQVTQVGGWTTGLTHSAGAGTNRMLVFFAGHENGKADTTLAPPFRDITGVDYGGQPLAQAAEAVVCTKSAANEWFCGRNERQETTRRHRSTRS